MPSYFCSAMFERVDRLEIEVVGRLVEHQHVRLLQHERQKSSRAVSPPDSASVGFSAFFAAEQHLAEQAVDVLARRVGIELVQPLDRGHALLNLAGVVLREVADRHLVAPADAAAVDARRRRRPTSGASASSAFSIVVLPRPLRPTSTIFSPRLTIALKSSTTVQIAERLADALDLERRRGPTAGSSRT